MLVVPHPFRFARRVVGESVFVVFAAFSLSTYVELVFFLEVLPAIFVGCLSLGEVGAAVVMDLAAWWALTNLKYLIGAS